MMATLLQVIRTRFLRWLTLTLLLVVGYHLLLIAALMLRFGALPNYTEIYPLLENYQLIFSGSPDWRDTLQLLLIEPMAELGYKNPDYYGISEWSLMLLPGKLLVIVVMSMLLSTSFLLTATARTLPCPASAKQYALGISGAGSALLALTNASVTWVVCCATPTWVVMLAMMGLSSSVALTLEPLGLIMGVFALLIMLAAILYQSRSIHKRLQLS